LTFTGTSDLLCSHLPLPRPYHISRRAFRSPETEIASLALALAVAVAAAAAARVRVHARQTLQALGEQATHTRSLDWTTPARVVYVDDLKRLVTAHHVTCRWLGERGSSSSIGIATLGSLFLSLVAALSPKGTRRGSEQGGTSCGSSQGGETTGHGYLSLTLLITHDRRRSCLARRCAHALLVCLLAYYVELKPGVRKAILGPHPSDSEALRSMSMAACSDPSGKFCCVLWFRAVRFGRCTF
jgi:hypothetical protein